ARVYGTRDGLVNEGISCLFESADGRLWVGNWSALSESLPGTKAGLRFARHTSENGVGDVTTLCEDRDGNLWIGTGSHGVMKIARSGFVSYAGGDGLGGTRIAQISETGSGELCAITAEDGKAIINRFDGGRFTAIRINLGPGNWPSFGWN